MSINAIKAAFSSELPPGYRLTEAKMGYREEDRSKVWLTFKVGNKNTSTEITGELSTGETEIEAARRMARTYVTGLES